MAQPLDPEVVSIQMRDSKYLAADVYVPDTEFARPTILIQTPYNKLYYRYGLPLDIGINISESPYNFVIVDWRGFYESSAAMVTNPKRGEDGYDVIEWIITQEWSDGKVGTWGASALGKIQYETAKEQHPAHICAVPLVCTPEYLYQTYFPNGAYRTEYVEQLDALGFGMSTTLLANPHYNLTWQYVENLYSYPEQIKIPMLLIGGWYDHNIIEMIKLFNDLRDLSDISVRDQHRFLIGPWAHGGFGPTQVGTEQQGELFFSEAAGWSNDKAVDFFAYYLLDADNDWLGNSVYQYFQMGDMMWHNSDVWPPQELQSIKLYLREGGELATNPSESSESFSTLIYDPKDPSPTVGGATLKQGLGQGPYDQSPVVESREDILIFTSDILDQALTHKGKAKIKLFVSSDRFDTDFAVRLCDVYPDNRSMLLNDNIFRMRFREGFNVTDTVFMQHDEIYEIEIELPDLAHTFLPGHRVRLDITSANYPRYNNNINNGGEMYVEGDSLIATNLVYHNSSKNSYIEFFIEQTNDIAGQKDSLTSIFPNPVIRGETLNIVCEHFINSIVITSYYGSVVYEKCLSPAMRVSINSMILIPGIYFVQLRGDGFSRVCKLIIL